MTVFISYNRQSEAIAKALADGIEALGHTVWLDQDLSGGQAWWDQILAAIRKCDVFLFILDSEALNSTACKREYGYAADLGKPILPVLVSGGVSTNLLPTALSQIQFVDYRKQDRDAAFRLARALTTVPPSEPLPDPLPPPPEVPISYLGSLTDQVETTSILSYAEQSALVVDLKRSLRDHETADDARTLLERLRKRRDLLAAIAEEIEELLTSSREPSLAEARSKISQNTGGPVVKGPTVQSKMKLSKFAIPLALFVIGALFLGIAVRLGHGSTADFFGYSSYFFFGGAILYAIIVFIRSVLARRASSD